MQYSKPATPPSPISQQLKQTKEFTYAHHIQTPLVFPSPGHHHISPLTNLPHTQHPPSIHNLPPVSQLVAPSLLVPFFEPLQQFNHWAQTSDPPPVPLSQHPYFAVNTLVQPLLLHSEHQPKPPQNKAPQIPNPFLTSLSDHSIDTTPLLHPTENSFHPIYIPSILNPSTSSHPTTLRQHTTLTKEESDRT